MFCCYCVLFNSVCTREEKKRRKTSVHLCTHYRCLFPFYLTGRLSKLHGCLCQVNKQRYECKTLSRSSLLLLFFFFLFLSPFFFFFLSLRIEKAHIYIKAYNSKNSFLTTKKKKDRDESSSSPSINEEREKRVLP